MLDLLHVFKFQGQIYDCIEAEKEIRVSIKTNAELIIEVLCFYYERSKTSL